MMEKLLEQEAMMEEDQKVNLPPNTSFFPLPPPSLPTPCSSFLGQEVAVDHKEQQVSRLHLPFHFILSSSRLLITGLVEHRACWVYLHLVLHSGTLLSHILSTQISSNALIEWFN